MTETVEEETHRPRLASERFAAAVLPRWEIFISFIMNVVDTGQSLTILRIKRKRNEETVDALVLSDSKRRKKGLDVFHFVQTVEREDSWNTKDFQVSPLISPSRPHI